MPGPRTGWRFLRLLVFVEEGGEAVDALFPLGAVLPNPVLEGVEAGGGDAAGTDAAYFFGDGEAAGFEDGEVLADGGEGDTERPGQMGDGDRALTEAIENGAAGGVAEGVKDAIDADLFCCHRFALLAFADYRYQIVGQFVPSLFAHGGAVGAFKEGALMGDDEVGSGGGGDEFKGDLRGGEDAAVALHDGGGDDALAGNDVLEAGFVGDDDAGDGGLRAHFVAEELRAAFLEIGVKLEQLGAAAGGHPLADCGGLTERGEDGGGGFGDAAFDDAGGVDGFGLG